MAIQLKDLKPKTLAAIEREIDYKGLVKLTLRVGQDKAFSAAMTKVHEQGGSKKVTKNALARDSFDENELSTGEAMLYLVGEYLITEWDVETPDGEIAPINGDNFTALCASVGDDKENLDFATHVFEQFQEMSKEFAAQSDGAKKKRLPSGTGSKKAAT
ncbi:hypothetical protein ACTXL0_07225 [Psychrobacter faecalis]|uniref:hypothetical protein n=1 Tax=Psychrobacter faecalis TaxID=180588 RepID=UPI003FD3EC98